MSVRRKLKIFVWHEGRCFFVSTIERESSGEALPPSRFNETMVWEYGWNEKRRGSLVGKVADGPAFDQHMRVCCDLYETGALREDETEGLGI